MARSSFLIFLFTLLLCTLNAVAEEASGTVFHDKNQNGTLDPGERGLPRVPVSNGETVVLTDAHGKYRLPVSNDTIVFVIKPSGWMTPTDPSNQIPRFYYIHKPEGSPSLQYPGVAPTGPLPTSINFPLYRQSEPRQFQVLCFGDTQTRNVEEVDFLTHDLLEGLVGNNAAFGVTLGDNVFNDLSLFEPLVQHLALLKMPWRYVPGNHDHNHDAPAPDQADESFERVFGPSYYAFNYSKVHFIVLNDIRHEPLKDEYHGGLGERQLAFIKNDLRLLPKNRLVVLLMHIPVTTLEDRDALFDLLKEYPYTFSLSAHTHDQSHVFIDRSMGWQQDTPHHHLIHGTACGSWWGGPFNEQGIPLTPMADGGPNGYSVITFDGVQYSVEFQAAGRETTDQMRLWLPENIAQTKTADTELIANVFAGSSRSTVEMRLDQTGDWTPLESFRGEDPYYVQMHGRQMALVQKWAEAKGITNIDDAFLRDAKRELREVLRGLPKPEATDHLWKAKLPADLAPGIHSVEVRTKDMFGHQYMARRAFFVQ